MRPGLATPPPAAPITSADELARRETALAHQLVDIRTVAQPELERARARHSPR
jgi:hypothetical protein